jgi:hypothetical protein
MDRRSDEIMDGWMEQRKEVGRMEGRREAGRKEERKDGRKEVWAGGGLGR